MKEEPFVVKYMSARDCYLYFSDYWNKNLSDFNSSTSALRVNYNGKHAYFSWSPQFVNAGDNSVVRISATYAQKLGIKDGEKVTITFYNHIASVSRVFMTPVSSDDFEILAMNQDVLQSRLLDQIQIIWPGQILVAWVGISMYAVLYVDSLEPSGKVGRLQLMTEIIVNTPTENPIRGKQSLNSQNDEKSVTSSIIGGGDEEIQEYSDVPKTASVVSFIWGSVQGFSSLIWGKEESEKDICHERKQNITNIQSDERKLWDPIVYRVHPFHLVNEKKIPSQFLHPYTAYVHKTNTHLQLFRSQNTLVVKLKPVSFVSKSNSSSNEEEKKSNERDRVAPSNSEGVYVKLCVLEDILDNIDEKMKPEVTTVFEHGGQMCIFLTKTVRTALQVKIGARVRLELENDLSQNTLLTVELTALSTSVPNDLETMWKTHMLDLCGESDILVNSDGIFPILSSTHSVHHILLKVVDPSVPYYLFTKVSLEKCKVKVSFNKNRSIPVPVADEESCVFKEDYHCFSHLQKQITHAVTSLEITLGLTSMSWSSNDSIISVANILIRGKAGSGASSLARHLCSKFQEPPYYVHYTEILCRNIKGKKVENLQRMFSQALNECSLHQPAILVLQDLDVLASASRQDQESAQDSRYHSRVGEMIVELLEDYQPRFRIAVVATAASSVKLNSSLMAPRGQHTFLVVLDIPDLNKDDRLNILERLVEKKVSLGKSQLDLGNMARKSDGYVVQDLVDFVGKAVFEAWKRKGDNSEQDPILENVDLENAFQLTQPMALRGVDLVQDSSLSWADIGGLDHAKKLLIEMLEWPLQFPDLFSQAPLRLQSGLLLYGAPGTGKTLLAGAVAKECGLNFISVKGPELLSKYIGASEEAVRTIFQKAQSAKPCVLFFDEFDSLAPRRGHDSTGVTDRVVNQLLTQLDGVESLNSVWVLAATSRPDLLDPALLRPGRLDRAVVCSLPTEEDRLAILQSLSRKMVLTEDVDLMFVAKNSEGFTGADLQAVLYSAQLAAVEQMSSHESPFENTTESDTMFAKEEIIPKQIQVTQALLLTALKDTRPSLSKQEKQKYDKIYDRFEKSRSSSSKSTKRPISPMKQKVTLA